MLELLHIENIAVIEESEICFDTGFNALTGETGAGKSIVIDALGAVLGRRTSRDLIRTGAAKARVTARFSGISAEVLEPYGVEEGEELFLQRELTADGKNVCRVNGCPVSVTQLRELGSRLLDIHGQHDGQQLLDEEQHGAYLDRFGLTEGQMESYRREFDALAELRVKIRSLSMDESEKARRMDTLRFQIDELERANLVAGEEERLSERREILRNSEKFSSAIDGADACLSGGEDSGGAVAALQNAAEELRSLKRYAGSFEELAKRLHDLYCEAADVAESLRDLRREYEFSPEELDSVEERCDRLYRLKKKYGGSVEEMLEYLDRCREELDRIEFAGDTLLRLQGEEKKQEAKVRDAGKLLSDARKAAAKELEQRILTELRQLDMPKVQFAVDFAEKEPAADGMDVIRFLMSANVGEALKPIDRVASGGELARIMLALKNVLAEQDEVGTLVFDEVDTGVSGRAAEKVAEKLAMVSRAKQVLCVTHLPQIAAMADVHFSVEKGERNGRTYTDVCRLDRAARCRELSRITGGTIVSDAMLRSSEELLDAAEKFKASNRS